MEGVIPPQYIVFDPAILSNMKPFFKDLFQYNNRFNQEIISALTENPGKVTAKCIKLLSHILNVHQIWNSRIAPGQIPYGSWEIHPIQEFDALERKNFEHSIQILDKFELTQAIQYSNNKGQIFNNSLHDILFQVINHSTYHRGQIATEFRQIGLEPILTDYIYYKMTSP